MRSRGRGESVQLGCRACKRPLAGRGAEDSGSVEARPYVPLSSNMSVRFSPHSPAVGAAAATPAGAQTADDDAAWPLAKLLARHQALKHGGGDAAKPAVLLTTGAMNPVHLGHVDMLVRARRCLEQEHGFSVLAGYISPSHEGYVRPKCEHFKQQYLESDVRLECVRRAVQDSDWLECGAWEAAPAHSSWPDFPVVVKALQSHLSGPDGLERDLTLGGQKCTVFYVCGLDHFQKCNLSAGLFRKPSLSAASLIEQTAGVVAIPRDDAPPVRTNLKRLVIGVTECNPQLSHLSSTKVRELLSGRRGAPKQPAKERRAAVAELVGEAVAGLLLPPEPSEADGVGQSEPESEPANS